MQSIATGQKRNKYLATAPRAVRPNPKV